MAGGGGVRRDNGEKRNPRRRSIARDGGAADRFMKSQELKGNTIEQPTLEELKELERLARKSDKTIIEKLMKYREDGGLYSMWAAEPLERDREPVLDEKERSDQKRSLRDMSKNKQTKSDWA